MSEMDSGGHFAPDCMCPMSHSSSGLPQCGFVTKFGDYGRYDKPCNAIGLGLSDFLLCEPCCGPDLHTKDRATIIYISILMHLEAS